MPFGRRQYRRTGFRKRRTWGKRINTPGRRTGPEVKVISFSSTSAITNVFFGGTGASAGTPFVFFPLHQFLQGVSGAEFVGSKVFVRHLWFRARLQPVCPQEGFPPSEWVGTPPCGRDIQVRYTVTEGKDGAFGGPTDIWTAGASMVTKQQNLAFRDVYLNREDKNYVFAPVTTTLHVYMAPAEIFRWDVSYKPITMKKKYKIMKQLTLTAGVPPNFVPDWDLQLLWQCNSGIADHGVQIVLDGRLTYTDE